MRKQIGFIFQAHNLFESLTAFQNVTMAAELVGRPLVGEDAHRVPAHTSGPGRPHPLQAEESLRRAASARGRRPRPGARPQIVLADEPTAALDKQTGREVVTLFQEMAKNTAARSSS